MRGIPRRLVTSAEVKTRRGSDRESSFVEIVVWKIMRTKMEHLILLNELWVSLFEDLYPKWGRYWLCPKLQQRKVMLHAESVFDWRTPRASAVGEVSFEKYTHALSTLFKI